MQSYQPTTNLPKMPPTFGALLPQITVVSYFIGPTGITIDYYYQGNEYTLLADPEQAADLLMRADVIEDYHVTDDHVQVKVELSNPIGYNSHAWAVYENWVLHFDLYQSLALELCAMCEADKCIKAYTEALSGDVQQLIRRLGA
jgi:hypothetical protein